LAIIPHKLEGDIIMNQIGRRSHKESG
jgi:hypothetical protein